MKIILKPIFNIEIEVPNADLQDPKNIDRVKEFIKRNVEFSEILESMAIEVKESNVDHFSLQIN